jgi:hypothetical protein
MNAIDVASRVASCFVEDHIAYAIGGALALGAWGVPRATKDVDIAVFAEDGELPRVIDSLERAGVMIDRGRAAGDLERIGMFTGRLGTTIVAVFMQGHPQYREMEQRVREVSDAVRTLRFVSPEDLVLYKLVFGRARDVADLERLFAVRDDLDVDYVRRWLTSMVPAGDRRHAILDDLVGRFTPR